MSFGAVSVLRSSIRIVVETKAFLNAALDALIIGDGGEMSFSPALLEYLRRAFESTRRVAATCAGAY
ncbi:MULTISPECIES: hypothetical protein [unclassified Bradyrhizobium]|uniref:hypothetical protein n=1 Tax=unclassified Bradyrhizobium TaxID=2631580 RepID=UPI001FF8542F|nr:hypothetical protein [Bradyrhizobium sp. 48]MCK1446716.1 hypothetical protein [Bradyrhizobium sp. 48]